LVAGCGSGNARSVSTSPRRTPRSKLRSRLPFLVLLGFAVLVLLLYAYEAGHPTSKRQSADERAYGILAINLAVSAHYGDRSTHMHQPLHWPPGAPALFAVGQRVFPGSHSERSFDIPAAYWLQAISCVGIFLAAFGLAASVATMWAGVAAAALVGLYPPLVLAIGEQLSEPLGALLLTLAFLVLAIASRGRYRLAKLIAAGALFGLAALTRADLLLVPVLVALLAGVMDVVRHRGLRTGAGAAAAILAGAALTLGPWIVYASDRAGTFVPVTQGAASALFVGTYLPGDGTTVGMKRALADTVYRQRPRSRSKTPLQLGARYVLEVAVASRHPGLSYDQAVGEEGRRNLIRYGVHRPVDFAAMMLTKVSRMWTGYARGGSRHASTLIRLWHLAVLIVCFAGLCLAIRRGPLVFAAILVTLGYATAVHAVLVSQPRYNLPLMPALIAGGVAGWAITVGQRSHATESGAPKTPNVAPQ
jgi:hypothetical protein